MDNFLVTVEGRDEDARDECTIDGQGAQSVELEECNEVVWAEGKDKVKLPCSRFVWQQGISRIVLDTGRGDDGDALLLNVPTFHQPF